MSKINQNNHKTHNKLCIAIGFLCLALLLFAYHKMGKDLFTAWQSGEYSHGSIIPFIAILIGWHRLNDRKPIVKPSWWGMLFLLASAMGLFIGTFANFSTAAQYGFISALIGITLTFTGLKATIILIPAFIYLLFAIPLPNLLYSNLSSELQLISSNVGVFILQTVGVSVFQEGNIIDLGESKLQVVEACSGLRYLFPLISFGYLVAYLLDDRMWKRIVIFLSTIPITIGMNSLRIAVIGITVDLWGPEMAEGFLHDLEGWVIFMICTIILMIELYILMRIGKKGRFRTELFTIPRGRNLSNNFHLAPPIYAAASFFIILAAIFGSSLIDNRKEIIPQHEEFIYFPTTIDKWQGKLQKLPYDILEDLKLTDYFLADYTTQDKRNSINLYIAYYESQRIGSSTHSPSNCIPGGGWRITDKSIKAITISKDKKINISRLLISKGDVSQLVYYWFDERGRNITETSYAKLYLMIDSITMSRTDGSLIRLVTQFSNKKDGEQKADERLQLFLSKSYPIIKTFLPQKNISTTIETEY